jgi:hypothetical protein
VSGADLAGLDVSAGCDEIVGNTANVMALLACERAEELRRDFFSRLASARC